MSEEQFQLLLQASTQTNGFLEEIAKQLKSIASSQNAQAHVEQARRAGWKRR